MIETVSAVDSASPAAAAPRRTSGHAATATLAVTVLWAAAAIAAAVLLPDDRVGDGTARATVVTFLVGMLGLAAVGAAVLRRRPGQRGIGRLLLAVGALGAMGRGVIALSLVDPAGAPDVLAWSTNWIWVPGVVAALLLLLRFPTGALPSPRWLPLERLVLAWGLVAVVVTAVVPGELAVTPLGRENPLGAASAAWLADLLGPLFGVLPVLTVAAASAAVVRYRCADGEERQQLRWVAAAVAALAVAAPLAATGGGGAALVEAVAYLLLPAAVLVAVLRYHLWDLGLVVRRSAVYAVASGLLLAAYVATVSGTSGLLDGRGPDAVATAVVAVAAVPVLTGVQKAVERLLFGERRDPDRVVATLAERLAATPEALLPQVVDQVAGSLRLPYVAVELSDGTCAAAAGAPTGEELRLPLRHRGSTVGFLLAAPRSSEPLDGHDRQLLQRVAAQAGLAVHSTMVTTELQQAADRLLAARAEERARLRGDLHDELGPALGAISMRAEAARTLLSTGRLDRVDGVLVDIERGAEAAVAEVRRILDDLHPRVLEEDGLEAALRSLAAALPDRLDVRLDVRLPPIVPPRMEAAAYRVAAEALRNVVRHAAAATVVVTTSVRAGSLELSVSDDGVGMPAGAQPGVGLRSMHARAAGLGGTLTVAPGRLGGTTVRLCLPMEQA